MFGEPAVSSHQQPVRRLEQVAHAREEARGGLPVDDAMVPGERERHRLALHRPVAVPTDVVEQRSSGARASLWIDGSNPVIQEAHISFSVAERLRVSLRVYDVAGRRVATLIDELVQAGRRDVTWSGLSNDGGRLSSGVYFVQFTAGETRLGQRIILLR